jgi:CTP synthase (UTP-ammonia lyase)
VLNIRDAGHSEYDPNTPTPVITLVSCPVEGRGEGTPRLTGRLRIRLSPDSHAFRIYRRPEIEEEYTCNYELDPSLQDRIERAGLQIVGVAENGEARIVELPLHRFFLSTLFLPQLSSTADKPHPLITAYLEAVRDR